MFHLYIRVPKTFIYYFFNIFSTSKNKKSTGKGKLTRQLSLYHPEHLDNEEISAQHKDMIRYINNSEFFYENY